METEVDSLESIQYMSVDNFNMAGQSTTLSIRSSGNPGIGVGMVNPNQGLHVFGNPNGSTVTLGHDPLYDSISEIDYEKIEYTHLSKEKQKEAIHLKASIIMARERLETLYQNRKVNKRKKIKLELWK